MADGNIRPVFKARISTLEGADANGNPDKARVLPLVGDGVVTRPYAILWSVRGTMGELAVGDVVVCARFEDGTGVVLCRADGEWGGVIPGTVEVETDVVAADVSLATHIHTAPDGETSTPH